MTKAEERLNEFLNRLCADYNKLQDTFPNLRRGQILTMLCQLDYVQYFALVPLFCRVENKLPQGYKKTDGRKTVIRNGHGRYKNRWTGYIVDCGDDLYISGLIYKHTHIKSEQEQWLVVEDRKSVTAMDVIGGIEQDGQLMNSEIRDGIIQFYKDYGLSLGMEAHCLREWR